MNTEKEKEEFVASLRKMLAMLPKSCQEVNIEKLKVCGLSIFIEDKIWVFGPKGQPDPAIIHAIVDRGNGMVVGFFFSMNEYMKSNKICQNIMYRLQPFKFF